MNFIRLQLVGAITKANWYSNQNKVKPPRNSITWWKSRPALLVRYTLTGPVIRNKSHKIPISSTKSAIVNYKMSKGNYTHGYGATLFAQWPRRIHQICQHTRREQEQKYERAPLVTTKTLTMEGFARASATIFRRTRRNFTLEVRLIRCRWRPEFIRTLLKRAAKLINKLACEICVCFCVVDIG
jgi:hypothetical protein